MKSSFSSSAGGHRPVGSSSRIVCPADAHRFRRIVPGGDHFLYGAPPPACCLARDSSKTVSTVGFNDQITLGALGETLENPQEVMQLKLLDPTTRQTYPMRDEVYLRGSVVSWYSQNHWRRDPPPSVPGTDPHSSQENLLPERVVPGKNEGDAAFRIGPPVIQQITMEPYLDRDDLFYIWPLLEPVGDKTWPPLNSCNNLLYEPSSGR